MKRAIISKGRKKSFEIRRKGMNPQQYGLFVFLRENFQSFTDVLIL